MHDPATRSGFISLARAAFRALHPDAPPDAEESAVVDPLDGWDDAPPDAESLAPVELDCPSCSAQLAAMRAPDGTISCTTGCTRGDILTAILTAVDPDEAAKLREIQHARKRSMFDAAMARVNATRSNGKPEPEPDRASLPEDRATVPASASFYDAMQASIAALRENQNALRLYSFESSLVRVDRTEQGPVVERLNEAGLAASLGAVLDFTKADGCTVSPTRLLLGAILAERSNLPFRRLRGISSTPFLRADGTVVTEPGFDERSGVFLDLTKSYPPLPEWPTREDAIESAERLLDLVVDFPFEWPSDRSAWLAFLLTLLVPHAVRGPLPMWVFDAPRAGSGKTKLAEIAVAAALGYKVAPVPWPTDRDGTEMGKLLISLALSGRRVVVFDNIPEGRAMGSAALEAALTSRRAENRILGTNTITAPPWNAVVCASGNNVHYDQAALGRRSLHVRIDAMAEKPESRTGPRPGVEWRYPDVVGHSIRHHPQLLTDALTILSAFAREGRPKQSVAVFGSYEEWTGLVPAALAWIGLPDPLGTRERIDDRSAQATLARRLFAALRDEFGATEFYAAEVAERASRNDEIREMLDEARCVSSRGVSVRRVGEWLSAQTGAVWDGVRLAHIRHGKRGAVRQLLASSDVSKAS